MSRRRAGRGALFIVAMLFASSGALRLGSGIGAALAKSEAEPAAPEETALVVNANLSFSEAKEHLVASFERQYLSAVLTRAEGNLSEAARLAQLDRKYFRELCVKHGLK